MNRSASKKTEQALQETLPQHGHALRSSVTILDQINHQWTLTAIRVGPSDASLSRFIADDIAHGSIPDNWRGDHINFDPYLNPLSPIWRWAETAASSYQRTYWDQHTRIRVRTLVGDICARTAFDRELSVLSDDIDVEHLVKLLERQRQLHHAVA